MVRNLPGGSGVRNLPGGSGAENCYADRSLNDVGPTPVEDHGEEHGNPLSVVFRDNPAVKRGAW